MSVSATGPGTLSYQWMKDGNAIDDEGYTGATTADLQTSSFSSEHVGGYKCRVSNENDSVCSSSAELTGRYMMSNFCS